MTPLEALRAGLQAHGRGDLAGAIAMYDRAIALDARLADAWMGRGVARLGLGRSEQAAADFQGVIAILPSSAQAFNNLGIAQTRLGQLNKALEAYGRAIQIDPRMAPAYSNRGELYLKRGEPQRALLDLQQACALDANLAAAQLNLARARRAVGDFAGAADGYVSALGLMPPDGKLMLELAAGLGLAGRYEQALSGFDAALGLGAERVDILAGKAEVLHRLERRAEALEHYDRLLELAPELAEAHSNRGKVLGEMGRHEESLAACSRAAALKPDFGAALVGQGLALHRLGRAAEAVACFDRAVSVEPENASFHNDRGGALHDAARFTEALAAFDRAVALQPGHVLAHNNRAFSLLIQGRFAEGWKALEWRKRSDPPIGVWSGSAPSWTGVEDLQGKTLQVFVEQGLGDVLQFCRLLPLLADRGARVVFSCPHSLHGLLADLEGIELVDESAPVQADYSLALMSMPGALGIDLEAVAGGLPYLRADPSRVAAWRRRLGEAGFKIGIAWRTSEAGERLGKGFALPNLAEIAAVPGVRLISLQKGADDELRTAARLMPIETLGEDFDSTGGAFSDTAAVMKAVDLIITADTSIAHLAGGLGVPTWTALKHVADWRWLHGRSDTPWYPTMTLFSQVQANDWREVFSRMRAGLIQRLAG